jgi:2-dehydropantoate 2-reductase
MAACLARAGLDVSIVARGAHLAAIVANGLRLIRSNDDFTVEVAASDDPADLGPQDLIISTVKAHALSDIAAQFKPLMHEQTTVVFAVNGIPWWYFHGLVPDARNRLPRLDPTGQLWKEVGADRVLGCVIRSPNEIVSPGVIRNNSTGGSSFLIGEPNGADSARLRDTVSAMKTGLPGTSATHQIREEIWTKLMLNVPSSLMTVLTVSTGPEIFANPEARELYRALGQETQNVAASYGVSATFDLQAQITSAGNHRHPPSMLQDLLARRSMEVEAQLRSVQELGRQNGVNTPVLDVTLALLVQRAKSEFAASL